MIAFGYLPVGRVLKEMSVNKQVLMWKSIGAPFQWAAIFHKEDINFTHGHHDLAWYDSGEKTTRHKLPCKVSCAYCHSWIMDEGRNMILLFPSLIKFGGGKDFVEKDDEGREERREKARVEREKFTPSCHMFYGQRCVDVNDGLPKVSLIVHMEYTSYSKFTY